MQTVSFVCHSIFRHDNYSYLFQLVRSRTIDRGPTWTDSSSSVSRQNNTFHVEVKSFPQITTPTIHQRTTTSEESYFYHAIRLYVHTCAGVIVNTIDHDKIQATLRKYDAMTTPHGRPCHLHRRPHQRFNTEIG